MYTVGVLHGSRTVLAPDALRLSLEPPALPPCHSTLWTVWFQVTSQPSLQSGHLVREFDDLAQTDGELAAVDPVLVGRR